MLRNEKLQKDIKRMYCEENLTIGDIAGMLQQSPSDVISVVRHLKDVYEEDEP